MKKFLLFFLFLLVFCSTAQALVTTENVDKFDFTYEKSYVFASDNLASNITYANMRTIPIGRADRSNLNEYVVSRAGRLVGLSVTSSRAVQAGSATFDVTINGKVTGIEAVLEKGGNRATFGDAGIVDDQYSYRRHDRSEVAAKKGSKKSSTDMTRLYWHDRDNPYGRATPLTAGNRIGVKYHTSNPFGSTTEMEYEVTVYVLE